MNFRYLQIKDVKRKSTRMTNEMSKNGSVQKVCWEFYAHNIESLYRKNGMSCTPLN